MRRSARLLGVSAASGCAPPAAAARSVVPRKPAATAVKVRATSNTKSATAGGGECTLPLTYEQAVWSASDRDSGGGRTLVVGCDEAGRGPLAGPVVAAAVALLPGVTAPPVLGINDSKQVVDEASREALYEQLVSSPAILYGVASIDHVRIDEINILQAAMLAMEEAYADLMRKVPACPQLDAARVRTHVFIDGPRLPNRVKAAAVAANSGPARARSTASAAVTTPPSSGGTVASDAVARDAALFDCITGADAVVKGDAKVYSIAAASIIAKVTRDRAMHEAHATWPAYGFDGHKGYGTAAHMSAMFEHGPSPIHRKTFRPLKEWILAGKFPGVTLPTKEEPCASALDAAPAVAAGTKAGVKRKRGL